MEYSNFAHSKVAEVEKENSGVEAAHKIEQRTEDVYRFPNGIIKAKPKGGGRKQRNLRKSRYRKKSISAIRSLSRKIPKCRKRP